MSPFNFADEYDIFRKSVTKLKESDVEFLKNWSDVLKPNEKEILENILKLKRITVETTNLTQTVPRKILKIKRANESNI